MGFEYILHVIICVLLIAVILFQDGKAGGLTSVSDSSQSVFGAKGAASFLTKLTSTLAILFMISSLTLNYMGSTSGESIVGDYAPSESSPSDKSSVKAADSDAPTDSPGDPTEVTTDKVEDTTPPAPKAEESGDQ